MISVKVTNLMEKNKIRTVKMNGAGYGKWVAADTCIRYDPNGTGTKTCIEVFY